MCVSGRWSRRPRRQACRSSGTAKAHGPLNPDGGSPRSTQFCKEEGRWNAEITLGGFRGNAFASEVMKEQRMFDDAGGGIRVEVG